MPNLLKRMRKLRTDTDPFQSFSNHMTYEDKKLTIEQLVDLRNGPGAAIFPNATTSTTEHPPITRLHLTYAQKIYGGHQGARHFWRRSLPRLKYYNPTIPMSVRQTTEQDVPATLTIYFAEKVSKAASLNAAKDVNDKHAPTAGEGEKAAVVSLKDLEHADIWKKVVFMTGAKEVGVSEEDAEEMRKLDAISEQAVKDRERVGSMIQARKDHEKMLEDARAEANRLRDT